jgi:hypothetical protein
MIFTEAEAEVNIIYLGTIDPYINRNESQYLFYYMKLLLMSSGSCLALNTTGVFFCKF